MSPPAWCGQQSMYREFQTRESCSVADVACFASATRLKTQMRFHSRPLAGNDGIDARIAGGSVRQNLVTTKDSVKFGTQSLDPSAALMVEKMRAEFYRDAIHRFERVGEQEEFALSVHVRSLRRPTHPSRTDFESPIDSIDIHIGCHPKGLARTGFNHSKWQHGLTCE